MRKFTDSVQFNYNIELYPETHRDLSNAYIMWQRLFSACAGEAAEQTYIQINFNA